MPTITAPSKTRRKVSTKRGITPEDLLRLHFVATPRISPDGRHVILVKKHVGLKNAYVRNLWMVSRTGPEGSEAWGPARQFTNGGKDTRPRWSPDGRRIAFVGARTEGNPQIFVIDVSGGEATALTTLPEGSIGTFAWAPDGRTLGVSFREQDPDWTSKAKERRKENGLSDPPRVLDHHWYRLDGDGYFNGQRYRLLAVDTRTGEHRTVYAKDTLGFFTFDFSPDSRQLVVSSNTERRAGLKAWNDDLLLVNVASGKVSKIPDLPRGPKDAVKWSPDGTRIAYAGREGDDGVYGTENLELWVCDPVRGKARCLTGDEDYCLLATPISDSAEVEFSPAFEWGPDGKRLFVQIGWQGELHLASVRPSGGKITFHTHAVRSHGFGNVSGDGRTAALTVGSPMKLDEVHVADLSQEDATTTALTDFNGEVLGEFDLSKPSSHWVKTPDGTKVHTWALMPRGFKRGRRYPAVLEIHGGPHAQYGVGFFFEFQLLAAAGYAVFFSNPRGSKGYGRDHCHAIRGSWGGADWVDIQAVTEFMKAHPSVDTAHMGIMGGSYGGYMTNWAIGHTNDFAGAITDRCVSNLVSMFGSSDFMEPPDTYWPGNSWDRPEALWQCSPIKYFGSVKTPTLIIHSEGDLRCNIEQAEQVFSILKLRNIPTRLVRYPRSTSHGFSRGGPPDLRVHRLGQILSWWKKYLQ